MTAGEVLIERGRIEGELRGTRKMLSKQLTVRFGSLPVWATAKLDGASIEQFDVWAERVLTASSLEEALG